MANRGWYRWALWVDFIITAGGCGLTGSYGTGDGLGGGVARRERFSAFFCGKLNQVMDIQQNDMKTKIKIAAMLLVIMGAIGVFGTLVQSLYFYHLCKTYEDPFPALYYLLGTLGLTIFFFVLSGKLHQGKLWARRVTLGTFTLFTLGDLVALLLTGEFALLFAVAFHGLGAYLLYSDRES